MQIIEDSWKIFLLYFFYAFGVPIAVIFTIYMMHVKGLLPIHFQLKLGEETCFVGGNATIERIYIIPAIVIMLVVNTLFYIITAITLYKIQKQNSKYFINENKRYTQNRSR